MTRATLPSFRLKAGRRLAARVQLVPETGFTTEEPVYPPVPNRRSVPNRTLNSFSIAIPQPKEATTRNEIALITGINPTTKTGAKAYRMYPTKPREAVSAIPIGTVIPKTIPATKTTAIATGYPKNGIRPQATV